MGVVAADTFTRANISANASIATGWGTPSDSPTDTQWNALNVTGSPTYAISANTGQITNSTGGNSLALGSGTTTDGEAIVEFQTTATAAAIGLMLRCDAGGTNRYQCRQKSGNFHLEKVVSGTTTDLITAATFTVSTNTNYQMRLRIVGSNLFAKIWLASGAEPAAWTLTATDTTFTSTGRYGVIAGPTATGQTISYSNYQLTSLSTKSVGMRTRLSVLKTVSAGMRTLLSVQKQISVGVRTLLSVQKQVSVGLRTRLALSKNVSAGVRTLLSVQKRISVGLRTRLSILKQMSVGVRSRIAPQKQVSVGTRTRLSIFKQASVGVRTRFSVLHVFSLGIRIVLHTATGATHSTGIRVILFVPFEAVYVNATGRDGHVVASGRDGHAVGRGQP